jgi:hypothetical protein
MRCFESVGFLFVSLCFIAGCEAFGPPPSIEDERPHYDILVEVGDYGFEYAVDQGGNYFDEEEDFTRVLPDYQSVLDGAGVELRLIAGPELASHFGNGSSALPSSDGVGVSTEALDGPVPFTPFYFSTGCGFNYISGCISRTTSYCAVRLRDTRSGGSAGLLFDMHAAAWRDAGRNCFGVYESARGLANVCTCAPSARDFAEMTRTITERLYQAFLAVGLTVAAAASMARMIAPVVAAGALAL